MSPYPPWNPYWGPGPYQGGPPPGYYQPAPNPEYARWWDLGMARICTISSVFGALFCFCTGAVTLALLTDPLFSQTNLIGYSIVSLAVLVGYFLMAAVFGLFLLAITSNKVPLGYRLASLLLMVLPGLLMWSSSLVLFLVPSARGLVASLPVMGAGLMAWATGTTRNSGNDEKRAAIFQWGLALQIILPILMSVLFEAVYSNAKRTGIIIIYPSFVFLGVLAIAQGYTAYALARRKWGSVFGRKAAPTTPQAAKESYDPSPAPRREPDSGPVLGPAAIAVLAVIFLAALSPAAYSLSTPPQLEVREAKGTYKTGQVSYSFQVVNRGGRATEGPVEVWLENATYRARVETIDHLEGYGVLNCSGKHLNGSIKERTRFDVVLYYNGDELDRAALVPPATCMIMPMLLPVVVAAWALPALMRRSRRRL